LLIVISTVEIPWIGLLDPFAAIMPLILEGVIRLMAGGHKCCSKGRQHPFNFAPVSKHTNKFTPNTVTFTKLPPSDIELQVVLAIVITLSAIEICGINTYDSSNCKASTLLITSVAGNNGEFVV